MSVSGSGFRTGGSLGSISKEELYHDILRMSPFEMAALKETVHQITGRAPSREWGRFDFDHPPVGLEHYHRIASYGTPAELAEGLKTSGGSFKSALTHGFKTLVRNSRKVVDAGQKYVPLAQKGLKFAQHIPVISKYAKQGEAILGKAEKALEVADTLVKGAEQVDEAFLGGPAPDNPGLIDFAPPGNAPAPSQPAPQAQPEAFGRIPPRDGPPMPSGPATPGDLSGAGFAAGGFGTAGGFNTGGMMAPMLGDTTYSNMRVMY